MAVIGGAGKDIPGGRYVPPDPETEAIIKKEMERQSLKVGGGSTMRRVTICDDSDPQSKLRKHVVIEIE